MLRGKKLDVTVHADTVRVEVRCGDAYAARVLYDDLIGRLARGGRVSIQLNATGRRSLTKKDGRVIVRPLPPLRR